MGTTQFEVPGSFITTQTNINAGVLRIYSYRSSLHVKILSLHQGMLTHLEQNASWQSEKVDTIRS